MSPKPAAAILLVEDDKQVRDLVEMVLRSAGFRVFSAEHAEDAERIFRDHHDGIDLLLTDVLMPSRSGYEIAVQFLAIKPELKVICMTGYSGTEKLPSELAHTTVCHLDKPFTPTELLEGVRQVVG